MDSATINLIKDIFTDAIKILGPATITAIVGYKIGKSQLEIKIKEIQEKHRFAAREHLFNYYKERQESLRENIKQLNESFGFILGFMAGGTIDVQYDITMSKVANFYLKVAPQEIKLTIRDFEKNELKDLEEYDILKQHLEKLKTLSLAEDIESLRDNILVLLEIYNHLNRCSQILLEKEASAALEPYINEKT